MEIVNISKEFIANKKIIANYLIQNPGVKLNFFLDSLKATYKKEWLKIEKLFWSFVMKNKNFYIQHKTEKVYYVDNIKYFIGIFIKKKKENYIYESWNRKLDISFPYANLDNSLNAEDEIYFKVGKNKKITIIQIINSTKTKFLIGKLKKIKNIWILVEFKIKQYYFLSKNQKEYPLIINNPKKFELKNNIIVKLVNLKFYPNLKYYNFGDISEIISLNNNNVSIKKLLYEYNLANLYLNFFSKKSLKNNKEKENIFNLYKKKSSSHIFLKKDFFLTIDSKNTTEIDDAFSIIKNNNNEYKIKIAIPNVGFFIKNGSYYDLLAKQKAETLYLGEQKLSMLPNEIYEHFTLKENKKIKVVICEFNIFINNENQNKFHIYLAEIINQKQLTYDEVNSFFSHGNNKWSDQIKSTLNHAFKISNYLNNLYFSKKINIPTEINSHYFINEKYFLNKNNGIAGKIIEIFMNLTNWMVANFMKIEKLPAIYRCQPIIFDKNRFKKNFDIVQSFCNLKSLLSNSVLDNVKLQELFNHYNYDKDLKLFVIWLICCTFSGAYFYAAPRRHSTLNLNMYCQFTSPIRRYFDLFNNQVLTCHLLKNTKGLEKLKEINLFLLCWKIMIQSKKINAAQRFYSINQIIQHLMKFQPTQILKGIICDFNYYYLKLYLPQFNIFAKLFIKDMPMQKYNFNIRKKFFTAEKNKIIYKIGDKLKCYIKKINPYSNEVFLSLIPFYD